MISVILYNQFKLLVWDIRQNMWNNTMSCKMIVGILKTYSKQYGFSSSSLHCRMKGEIVLTLCTCRTMNAVVIKTRVHIQ